MFFVQFGVRRAERSCGWVGGAARTVTATLLCRAEPPLSIRQAPRRGEGIEPPLADEVGGEAQRAENLQESDVADVEAAGIGAERRHHQPRAVGREAFSCQRAAALVDAGGGMQVAGDLAVA